MTKPALIAFALALGALGGMPFAYGAETEAGVVHPIAGNLHLAVVEDRNTPFLVGDDAVLLAETNFERNAAKVRELIGSVTPNPVRFVVNSHWHPDHVGGNALFAADGALTISHDNTRVRMIERQRDGVSDLTPESLPVLTFNSKMTLYLDGENIDLVFYPDAHTDSDVVMYFRESNIVYIGGLLNYPMYAGVYDAHGFLDSLDQILAVTNENTTIIPWRGPVVGKAEVQEWRNVLSTVSERVSDLMADGLSLEEIRAAQPSREFDAKWGNQRSPEQFLGDVYTALSNSRD
jgi:cyclase